MPLHGFSNAAALDASVMNAHGIMVGFNDFIRRHKGTVNGVTDYFCLNDQNIILNNMHYEVALSGYMPNGTATTEGQSLFILGYIYLYKATGDQKWLDFARLYYDAYLKYFYKDTPIPPTPTTWRCHWAINGKQPFRTLGPVNYQDPSASGAWDVPVVFNNGVGYVPAGTPYYGEQVARVYNVYDGKMNWDNVMATPTGGAHGTYAMDFFVDDRGIRMTYDGTELDDSVPQTTYPTRYISLTDKTFNGTLNISFSCRSGLIIDRNQPFEGWPMWQHVEKAQYGNSGDSEEWFCEASYMMFELTGEQKYLRAFQSSLKTLWDSANLPSQSLMFMHDTGHISTTPFTEGISFWWNYVHNCDAQIARDPSTGYIYIEKTEELFTEDTSQVAIEQMALINKVNEQSYIHMQMGINVASTDGFINMFATVSDSLLPNTGRVWRQPIWSNNNPTPQDYYYPLGGFIAQDDGAGNEYVMLTGQSFVPYNEATSWSSLQANVLGDSRRVDYVGSINVPDTSSGVVLGFWNSTPTTRPLGALSYRYTGPNPLAVTVRDANNWKWEYVLPYTTDWTTVNLDWSQFYLTANQDNTGARPGSPAINNALTQIQIASPDAATAANAQSSMDLYCFGTIPPFYSGTGYMNHWKWMVVTHNEFVCNIGDCEVLGTLELRAKYTPGVIPFSTNYSQKKGKREYYRGTPYTGYVYPAQWLLAGYMDGVQNCIDYWYDAQEDWKQKYGIYGPLAPVYVWPRWDNVQYGAPETFVYVEWGYAVPWAGYYSRTFYSATHLWQMLHDRNMAVDPKLVTVCERWATYLSDFMDANDDNTPTVFPPPGQGMPYNDGYDPDPTKSSPDHTGHMTAHFLCGAIFMKMAGSTHPKLDRIIDGCVREFERTYVIKQGTYQDMSGSYSSWYGGHYFYGFWAGEIMRAFAMLMIYRDWQRRQPPTNVVDLLQHIALEDGTDEFTLEDASGFVVYDNPVCFGLLGLPLYLEDGTDEFVLEADDVTPIALEPL